MTAEQYVYKLNEILSSEKAREHSYRGVFEAFLNEFDTSITAINEPKHIRDVGAPDFAIMKNSAPIGYIETKDVDKNLKDPSYKEQFNRYKNAFANLIITNYISFEFWRDQELIDEVDIGEYEPRGLFNSGKDKIKSREDNSDKLKLLLKNFISFGGISVKTASDLARYMANKTKLLAAIIRNAIDADETSENQKGDLAYYKAVFQKMLIPDIDSAKFADLLAQTIAYGMFTARISDLGKSDFSRYTAFEKIPRSNPFLKKLFHYIGGNIDDRIVRIIDDFVELFKVADFESIMREIHEDKTQNSPIIHFYETFLSHYNPAVRKTRGVYYTPKPAIDFIVRAVNDILRQDFNMRNGLADSSKIKFGDREIHKLQILDPATGTGAFLTQIINKIYESIRTQGQSGLWDSYVSSDLLPRLHGFEVLMSSYAMAHLNISLILEDLGYKFKQKERLGVYLTNSLDKIGDIDPVSQLAVWLTEEAKTAKNIKENTPVMVLLGNPPYSGESINKSEFITNLMREYKLEPNGDSLQEKSLKWINDDYVKFIRMAESLIERTGYGIIAFINNHGFLDNPTFRGMRYHLAKTFDKIYILNLHGNSLRKEQTPSGYRDENIFDIMVGVSINIFVKTSTHSDNLAEVLYSDLYGTRNYKYDWLFRNNINNQNFIKLKLESPYYFFVKKDAGSQKEYKKGFAISDLFKEKNIGIMTKRDSLTVHFTEEEIKRVYEDMKNLTEKDIKRKYNIPDDTRDWILKKAQSDIRKNDPKLKINKIHYRPFDFRFTLYTGRVKGFMAYPCYGIMKYMFRPNIALVSARQLAGKQHFILFATDTIIDKGAVANSAYVIFPLYTYTFKDKDFKDKKPNYDENGIIIDHIQRNIRRDPEPEEVFDYIYGVLHSPKYREKYEECLKVDFPRVPYPQDAAYFDYFKNFGEKLRKLHLLESEPKIGTTFSIKGDNKIEVVKREKDRVYINKEQFFGNIPNTAWEFYIGGYQPAQKYLKDRKDRELSYEEIKHYQKIIAVLIETASIMKEIDENKWGEKGVKE
ncbi:MAG: N-6 DNA methylase [Helicobacteraceae bacterium]|jgi:hypothetical protein|nr:N-6 DNA methylase [Helicobacteraceae bacterium]